MQTRRKLAYCKTGEAAELLGVSLRTVQLWVDAGILEAWLTEGGHRRIRLSSVNKLLSSQRSNSQQTSTDAAATPLFRVLVADDNVTTARHYKTHIESWDLPVQVSIATDGYDALMRVGREPPHLMITGTDMAGVDSQKLIGTLTTSSCCEGMKIAFAEDLDSSLLKWLPQGVHRFPRNAPMAPLRDLIGSLIEQRSATAA